MAPFITSYMVVDMQCDKGRCPTMHEVSCHFSALVRQGKLSRCGYDRSRAGNRIQKFVLTSSNTRSNTTLDSFDVRESSNTGVRESNMRG